MIGEFKFMDLLYSRYASPMDLIKQYINRGQFGKFVTDFLEAVNERKKEQEAKEDEWKMWMVYVHSYSYSEESFYDWKKRVLKPGSKRKTSNDSDLTNEKIMSIIDETFNL